MRQAGSPGSEPPAGGADTYQQPSDGAKPGCSSRWETGNSGVRRRLRQAQAAMRSAAPKSTETSWLTPFSCMVTPKRRSILAMVIE